VGLLIRSQLPHPSRENYKRYGSVYEIDVTIFVHQICYGGFWLSMRNLGALVYEFDCLHIFCSRFQPNARGSRVVWPNLGFRQKEIVSTKGEISPDPRGGRILELTSQIVFGCVLTKVLWFKCVENMV